MTRQKERACPCANTDKPNMDDFSPEYTMDMAQLQYAGILYYATDGRGHNFKASTVLRMDSTQFGDLIHWLHYLYNSIYEITRLEAYP